MHVEIENKITNRMKDMKRKQGNTLTQFTTKNKKRTPMSEVENLLVTTNEVRPPKDMRFDSSPHMPGHDDIQNETRCKFEGCEGKSNSRNGRQHFGAKFEWNKTSKKYLCNFHQ